MRTFSTKNLTSKLEVLSALYVDIFIYMWVCWKIPYLWFKSWGAHYALYVGIYSTWMHEPLPLEHSPADRCQSVGLANVNTSLGQGPDTDPRPRPVRPSPTFSVFLNTAQQYGRVKSKRSTAWRSVSAQRWQPKITWRFLARSPADRGRVPGVDEPSLQRRPLRQWEGLPH